MMPVLFTIPGLEHPVYTYGVLMGIAFLTIWLPAPRLAARTGSDPRVLSMAVLIAVIPFLIGARLFVFWANPHLPRTLQAFLDIRSGGIAAYGGFAGGLLAAYPYFKARGSNPWRLADAAAPFLVLALGIVRLGCFASGCCFGKPTESFLGVRFPPGSVAFEQHLRLGLAEPGASGTLPLHPVQLYEAGFDWILAGILLRLHRRRELELKGGSPGGRPRPDGDGKDGRIFWTLAAAYAGGRFLMEYVRDDRLRGTVWGVLTQGQFVGLVLIGLAAYMIFHRLPGHPFRPRPGSRVQDGL